MCWFYTINSTTFITFTNFSILLLKFLKIEGLILWITEAATGGVLEKDVEIAVAIFKNFFKIAVKLPCESVVKIPEKYL